MLQTKFTIFSLKIDKYHVANVERLVPKIILPTISAHIKYDKWIILIDKELAKKLSEFLLDCSISSNVQWIVRAGYIATKVHLECIVLMM